MVLRREVERARLAPAAHFLVGRLVAALGHGLVQQIGQAQLPGVELGLDAGDRGVAVCELVRELLGLRSSNAPASSPLPLAMPTALAFALRSDAHAVGFDLRVPCARSSSAPNAATSSMKPAAREIGGHACGVGTQLFGIEHVSPFVTVV